MPNDRGTGRERVGDPERIYLQPECCASLHEDRVWCDHVPQECEEGVPWTEYVRTDLTDPERREENAVRKTPDEDAADCLDQLSYALHDVETVREHMEWAMRVIGRLLNAGFRTWTGEVSDEEVLTEGWVPAERIDEDGVWGEIFQDAGEMGKQHTPVPVVVVRRDHQGEEGG